MMKRFDFIDSVKIKEIIRALCVFLDSECSEIFLYGSAASNDLVYLIENDQLFFLSDIEFIVILKQDHNKNLKEYGKKISNACYEYLKSRSDIGKAPFVDVNVVSRDYFRNLQMRISTFELRENGKCLKGENYLEYLPQIGTEQYNPMIQNIEIIKGLKILLLESYKYFLCCDNTAISNSLSFCYFLSSSFLNILRTLLPLYGKFVSTSEKRVFEIGKLKNDVKIKRHFSNDVMENFGKIYSQKRQGKFSNTPKELFLVTYKAYKELLCLILDCNESVLTTRLAEKKDEIFWGDQAKKDMLADLANFFISALECLNKMIIDEGVSLTDLKRVEIGFDRLLATENAFRFAEIMEHYTKMEKLRWKIIGSKD